MEKLNQIWQWIEKRMTVFKAIFMLSMLVFVIIEVGRIGRDLSGAQLRQSLADQSIGQLAGLLIAGFVAVLPMLNYDLMIVKFLPGTFKRRYVLRSGWIVNTFTNIAGFGGFLGASLRANFYSQQATHKQIIFAISKIALFLLSGLSMLCWLGFALLWTPQGQQFQHYWFWLVGGGLYTPLMLFGTHWRNSRFFEDLTWQRSLRLLIGSTLEWTGCIVLFLMIGHSLNGNAIQNTAVIPLFAAASVVGVVSMVPGGLGTFDVFMILGLGFLGVNRADAVLWLLFYRLFYYVFPFALGVIFFIQDTGHRLNTYLEGLPVQLGHKLAHGLLVLFLYFSGIMLLLMATVPNFAFNNRLVARLYPFTFMFISQTSMIVVAFLLLGLARGIANKVQQAYWPTLLVLGIASLNTLVWDFSLRIIILLSLVFVATLFTKRELYRQRLTRGWGAKLVDNVLFAGAFILYALVGLYNWPHHHVKPKNVPQALFFPSERLWLSGFIGMLVAALMILLIYHYLGRRQPDFASTFDAARFKALIQHYGGNEISHLAYLKDKYCCYYQVAGEDRVLFLFQFKADKLVLLGPPIGNQADWTAAIADLMQLSDRWGYSLVFYEVDQQLTMQLHEMGYDFIKIGEEGYVDLTDFSLAGKKRKTQRTLLNKFEREGYHFQILKPPFTTAQLTQLKIVSDSWLDGRAEEGFSLGFFDENYLQQAPIAVIKAPDDQIIAFANLMPMAPGVLSIDLMRHQQSAPAGIMDELFIHLFLIGPTAGYQTFDLGNTPLANVGVSRYAFLQERAAHLIYQYGYRFYGFQGLRAYKEKYVTQWQPKYVAYRKRHSVLFVLLQIMGVVNQKVKQPAKRSLLIPHWLHWARRPGPDEN